MNLVDVTSRPGLEPVVANRAGCAECFFDIAGFDNMLDPVGITSPNAGEKIRLQFEPDREPIIFRFADATARRIHTIGNAEQFLHVMSNLVGDNVALGEIASCTQAFLELTEKTEVDVNASISRTIERTGCAAGEATAGLNQVREEHKPRLLVLPAHLPEDLVPSVFGIGENDGDKFRCLIARRLIIELSRLR